MKVLNRLYCFLFGHNSRWSPDGADDYCRRCGKQMRGVPRCTRRVVCAAIRHRETGLIICSPRHQGPIQRALIETCGGLKAWQGHREQGFVDNFDNWLTREEAHTLAAEQGQIRRRCGGDRITLYSENLY